MKKCIIVFIFLIYITVYTSPYRDGLKDGEKAAYEYKDKYKWSALSCLSSFLFSACGCTIISLYSYFYNIPLPINEKQKEKMYILGFKKNYIPNVKKANIKYSIIGGGIGTVLNLALIIILFSINR